MGLSVEKQIQVAVVRFDMFLVSAGRVTRIMVIPFAIFTLIYLVYRNTRWRG